MYTTQNTYEKAFVNGLGLRSTSTELIADDFMIDLDLDSKYLLNTITKNE